MNYSINWLVVEILLTQAAISLVLYGLYVALFLLSLYALSRRRSTCTKLLIIASYAMAAMGTTQIAVTVATVVQNLNLLQGIVEGNQGKITSMIRVGRGLNIAAGVTFVVNNFITDCIFMYRCYVIWSCQMKPIILPALLLVLTFGIGCYTTAIPEGTIVYEHAAYILAATTNLCFTALTAGRIFWARRAASAILCPDSPTPRRYMIALGITLESGAVYLLVMMTLVIGDFLNLEMLLITRAIAQQLMGEHRSDLHVGICWVQKYGGRLRVVPRSKI
ncbi:hypothetical protein R3P38DRAFT_929248 [Favolaschia claudopus]|uniref:Uncharacterized protein n=1 Tax=Favolaschia claudopus TaxID=2862362 RepID=A0AAW0BSR3_9AGAR